MTDQSLELMFPRTFRVAAQIAKERWDAEANVYNKWPELGQDEKDELIKQVIVEHLDKSKGRL